jgi:hypothetical protein
MNARMGAGISTMFVRLFVYYFLDELHERHKTMIFSSIFEPPLARDNI